MMNYFRNTEEFHIDFMVGRCLESCLLSAFFGKFWFTFWILNQFKPETESQLVCAWTIEY